MYTIRPGTTCWIRKRGDPEWKPFVTRRTTRYNHRRVIDNGGFWVFVSGVWEMKVLPRLVFGDKTKNGFHPKGNFGTTRGKGASRRRNMRYAKRRK